MNTRFKFTLFAAAFALAATASAQLTDVKQTGQGTLYGKRTDSKIGFFGLATPASRPANTRTARQALQDLGLMASGGAQDSDVFSLTSDNTLGEGVDLALGTTTGTMFGTGATQKLSFYGATRIVRPAGTSGSQSALTDSTTGTASTTLAAGAGVTTIPIAIQLAAMTTSAADLVTDYTPGYKFKILAVDFATTTIGAGSGASQTLNLEIGSTNLSGGVVNPTLTSTNTLGKLTAGTAVTANNTGTASDTISVEVAASGTVFTGGSGVLLITIQNLDTADAFASLTNLANGLRAALAPTTGVGLIKGSD